VPQPIEASGKLETAGRVLQLASMVFRYVVATARLAFEHTRDLRDAVIAPKSKHLAAITGPIKVGGLSAQSTAMTDIQ